MRPLALVLLLVAVPGCGPGDPASAFCSKVGAAPSCGSSAASKCTAALASGKSADATCAPFIDALVACTASLKLSCISAATVAAVGDGTFNGPQNFSTIGGYDITVNDSKCDVYRRGLEACRTCPTAAGSKEVESLGIGDSCASTTFKCATGLSCQSGICTRTCSSNGECDARADGCRLQVQQPNVCVSGKCTRSCSGSNFGCVAWIGKNSVCTASACTLP